MLPALKPKWTVGAITLAALCLPGAMFGQDRWDHNWDHDWDHDQRRVERLDVGRTIPIRMTDTVDTQVSGQRIYHGVVAQDIMDDNGRVAIPQGAPAELRVRVMPDNNLVLHLEAVTVHGDRYGTETDPNRIQATQNNTLVGSIIGAIRGGQYAGQAVTVPQGTVLTFRLDRPLEIIRHWE